MAQSLDGQLYKIMAGESFEATLDYSDYPANDGWSASVIVAGAGFTTTTACTTSGTTFVLAIPATTTATWKPGTASATVRVTKDTTNVKTAESSCFTIVADATAQTAEMTILTGIKALIAGVAVDDQLTTQLDGIGLTYTMRQNIDKLWEWHDRYKRIVDAQIRQMGGKGGIYAVQHRYNDGGTIGSPWYGGYPPRVR